jgi:hypothetical protein
MSRFLSLLLFMLAMSVHGVAVAQSPELFIEISPGGDASPAEAYNDLWSVELNAEQLRNPVQSITLNLPGQPEAQIQLQHWEARRGYITYEDDEGVVHTIPDPKAGPDDFSWLWYGKGEGWTVSLTMHKGVIAGRVSSAERRYGLEPRPERVTQLGWINSDYWTTHPDERPGIPLPGTPEKHSEASSATAAAAQSSSPTSPASWDLLCSAPLNTSNLSVVDVLVLYTPQYLSNAGSVVQVEAAVQAALDDANTSLRNSAISSLLYSLAGVEAVPVAPGFNYDSQPIVNGLNRLSGNITTTLPCDFSSPNTAVRARRDANYADVVALARKTTIPNDNSCGVGWIQHKVTSVFFCDGAGSQLGRYVPLPGLQYAVQCRQAEFRARTRPYPRYGT